MKILVEYTEKEVLLENTKKDQMLIDGDAKQILQKTLELKEAEVDMQQKYNQLMMKEKAKAMTRLVNSVEEYDNNVSRLKFEMKDLYNKHREVDKN